MEKDTVRKVSCPKCHRYFLDIDIRDWPDIGAKHAKFVAGTQSPKDGDSIACPFCRYELTTYDIILSAAGPPLGDIQPGQEARH